MTQNTHEGSEERSDFAESEAMLNERPDGRSYLRLGFGFG
jgi:hypothetical protein